MKTVFDRAVVAELVERANAVNATSARRWGKMNPDQMLHHVNSTLESYLNTGSPQFTGKKFKAALLRFMTFTPIPIPRGVAPTLPEFVADGNYDLIAEQTRFATLLEKVSAKQHDTNWPVSQVFGKLSAQQYGKLAWKHTDHHLQQFGV